MPDREAAARGTAPSSRALRIGRGSGSEGGNDRPEALRRVLLKVMPSAFDDRVRLAGGPGNALVKHPVGAGSDRSQAGWRNARRGFATRARHMRPRWARMHLPSHACSKRCAVAAACRARKKAAGTRGSTTPNWPPRHTGTSRWSSSRERAPARPAPSLPGSPTCSNAALHRNGSCCSRSPAVPPTTCSPARPPWPACPGCPRRPRGAAVGRHLPRRRPPFRRHARRVAGAAEPLQRPRPG